MYKRKFPKMFSPRLVSNYDYIVSILNNSNIDIQKSKFTKLDIDWENNPTIGKYPILRKPGSIFIIIPIDYPEPENTIYLNPPKGLVCFVDEKGKINVSDERDDIFGENRDKGFLKETWKEILTHCIIYLVDVVSNKQIHDLRNSLRLNPDQERLHTDRRNRKDLGRKSYYIPDGYDKSGYKKRDLLKELSMKKRMKESYFDKRGMIWNNNEDCDSSFVTPGDVAGASEKNGISVGTTHGVPSDMLKLRKRLMGKRHPHSKDLIEKYSKLFEENDNEVVASLNVTKGDIKNASTAADILAKTGKISKQEAEDIKKKLNK